MVAPTVEQLCRIGKRGQQKVSKDFRTKTHEPHLFGSVAPVEANQLTKQREEEKGLRGQLVVFRVANLIRVRLRVLSGFVFLQESVLNRVLV